MKTIRLISYAELDVSAAIDYYEKQAQGLGREFAQDVEHEVELVAESPKAWPEKSKCIRKKRMDRFPYSLIYREYRDEIVVLAVMHGKRRPSFWFDRKKLGRKS